MITMSSVPENDGLPEDWKWFASGWYRGICTPHGGDDNSVEITPDECCPACKKKGLKQALRVYRINFEESIFLCENPKCIYPLGSEPLSNIIIPTDSKDYPSRYSCRKRKLFDTSLVTSPIAPCLKLTKGNTLMDTEQTLKPDFAPKCSEDHPYEIQSELPDGSPVNQPNFNNTSESMEQKTGLEMAVQESSLAVVTMQAQLLPDSSVSETLHQDNKSLPEPLCLQWKNVYALCWLDCILSALVHLETLKMNLSGSVSENLPIIQKLLTKYNQATELVNTCQRGEHVSEIPLDVLSRVESHLDEIRNTIFLQLQPQLKCKLGQEESPVFAFPLLLKKDPQIEKLFLHSFSWKFECLQCGHQVSDRCEKTLTTFTNIIPEWHPLNAVHIAPCNKCNHTSQRRKMVLEKVPSILMIHFVQGLAHSDLTAYSFLFQEDSYQITTVVQYQEAAKHFITWILNSDGTWLECDDLKGSYCSRHKNFGVPPSEVHIVIWERKTSQVTNDLNLQLQSEGAMNVPLPKAQPNSPVKCVDNKAVDNIPLVCHREDIVNAHTNKTENVVSNNKSSFLWGLENLADDDVITLTLVNVPLDAGGKPLDDSDVIESHPLTGTLQQQDPGGVDVSPATSERGIAGNDCMLLENASTSLQGQPKQASTTFIMPAVPLSNSSCLPETLPVQGAKVKGNIVPVNNSSPLEPENPQNKIRRTIPGNSVQETSNIMEHAQKIPANSQVSAPNNSFPTLHMNGTKARGGSWVKGLLQKSLPFMPKGALASNKTESSIQPFKKETASNSLIKGASHFHGFQAKCSNQKKVVAKRALDDSPRKLPPSSPATSLGANLPVERHASCRSEGTGTKNAGLLTTLDKQIQSKQSRNENKNFTCVENVQDSRADQTHQLRLRLQKLKAEKKKLDKLAKTRMRNRSSPKTSVKGHSQLGSQKENQSLLKELQHQIDVEDGKSVNSPSTNVSQCSSSSYDDILSELLSPATTVASLELPQEEECRYLEMGVGSPKSPVHSEKFDGAQATNCDHSYPSPVKRNVYEGHTDLLVNKSPLKKLSIESPPKHDILEDLLPNSMLNSIMFSSIHNEDLHHFDESLFSW